MNITIRLIAEHTQLRLSVSAAISLLLHLFLFSVLVTFSTQPKRDTQSSLPFIQARLMPGQPALRKTHPEKKLLTTKVNSDIKIAEPQNTNTQSTSTTPTPPVEANVADTEKIGGVAFPGSIPTPFSNIQTRGNVLFSQRNTGIAAQQQYQLQMQQHADNQYNDPETEAKLKQLESLLRHQINSQPELSGQCRLIERQTDPSHSLACDSPALQALLAPHANQIAMLLTISSRNSRKTNGFIISPANNMITFHYFMQTPK